MSLIPIKTPRIVKRMFPNYIWDIPSTNKTIYLTFDDGPTPKITNWVLNLLKQYQAKATFFCIGHNIEKHPNLFYNIINEGHTIGNHTYNHLNGWKTKTKVFIDNVSITQDIINSKIGNHQSKTKFIFRPPYGKIKPTQSKQLIKLGYQIIMWDILSFDWNTAHSPEACLNNVLSKAANGSIIVFHDSIKASKNMQYALPYILEHFSKLGYCFKSIH